MKRFIIAITRTCGSGASTIAKLLSEHYDGIDIYDRKLLRLASEDSGINESLFANADEDMKNTLLYKVSREVYHGELIPPESDNFISDRNLYNYQAKVLKELAKKESYIVIGRGADYILRSNPDMISVYLTADHETCVKHMMEMRCTDEAAAERYVRKMNRFRSSYYTYHTGRKWQIPENYDFCLRTDRIGYEKCAEVIEDYIALK